MFKITPNPPETDDVSPTKPQAPKSSTKPPTAPSITTSNRSFPKTPHANPAPFTHRPRRQYETLLVNACESLAAASVMLSDFAGQLNGPQRNTVLGIQNSVMLGELAVNRMLDNFVPT